MITVSSRLFLATVLVAAILTGCQTRRTSEPGSASPAQPSTEAAKQPTAEKPSLIGQVASLSLYPVPNNPKNLAISVVVTVSNSGPTSNAQGWTLSVNSPGKYDLRGLQPVHVNGVVAMPGTGTRVDLDKEDLVIKSKDTPISTGATLKGILTFVMARTSAADLSNNNSTLVIHFKDSQGNSYQTPNTKIGAKR